MAERKRILAIGGTYFAGRVFSIYASRRTDEYEYHALNRGNRPLANPAVTEHIADRADSQALVRELAGERFDVVVDFCAYRPGDIRKVFSCGVAFDRYIEFSTVNVYDPQAPFPQDETTPLASVEQISARRDLPDEVRSYLTGKRALEDELVECSREAGTCYTVLRPAFIYGPFDYSPRLLRYLAWVAHDDPVPFPVDSESLWSFIYVKDIGNLLFKVIESDATRDRCFNLAAPDTMDWETFERLVGELEGKSQTHVHLTMREVEEQALPIMFPIEGNEWYSGKTLAGALGGFEFTPFRQGLRETWDLYKDVL